MFLDMDRFKSLNDTLGHEYGDMLLIEVAKRLKSCVRDGDTVARLGGDEFVVVVESISDFLEDASFIISNVAEKIRLALASPYQLNKFEYLTSPSIGVYLYGVENDSVNELIKRADMAMYQAKDSGRNAVRFFDPQMQELVNKRSALESDLQMAIPNNQFELFYQIQLDQDQRPIGAEALIRWNHPLNGLIPPGQFIPFAEGTPMILDIGHWVLDTACIQISIWSQQASTRHLVLAVNISAQQFKQPEFVDEVANMINKHGIDPSSLKLELTESVAVDDIDSVVMKMDALRKLVGVTLSLDDFGTGYSSLSYLKRLPLDQIKIDQSFVRDITIDPADEVMVKTIIDMAHNFGLNVIAEGVETEAHLSFLKKNGCKAFQGYLFSKPVPLVEFEELLHKYQS
jgi:diguanylate cyclase (GGDEF)-like protein